MFRSVSIGRAFGIPLYVHPTFLLLPLWGAVISWGEGLTTVLFGQAVLLAVFACVLLHELGHALMARRFGVRTRDITLYPIGGVARLEGTGNKPAEEVAIALAGPAVNLAVVLLLAPFVVASIALGLIQAPVAGVGALSLFATFLAMVAFGNAILLVFNLLPVFPMDGGRVLRAVLSLGLGQLRGTEIAAYLGLVLAVGLALLGLGLVGNFPPSPGLVVVAAFVAFAGQMELAGLRRREAARRARAREAEAVTLVRLAPLPILPVEEVVIRRGPEGLTGYLWDRENGVWVRWVDGRPCGMEN